MQTFMPQAVIEQNFAADLGQWETLRHIMHHINQADPGTLTSFEDIQTIF